MIHITEKTKVTKIYLVTNCYGDPNKVYIGKTKNKDISRKSPHKIKFGKEIIFTIIDEVNSLDHKDWKSLETFWIQYFKFLGFEILNKNEGGGGPLFQTKETREKISKPRSKYKRGIENGNYGIPKSNIHKINMRHPKSTTINMCIPNPQSGKTRSKIIEVYDFIKNETTICYGVREVSILLNISKTYVRYICNRKNLNNIYKNYKLKYVGI